jgi:hypothetical protein
MHYNLTKDRNSKRFNDFHFFSLFFFFCISDVYNSCIMGYRLKYTQLSLRFFSGQTWNFLYRVIPNNITDKTQCNFYHY